MHELIDALKHVALLALCAVIITSPAIFMLGVFN